MKFYHQGNKHKSNNPDAFSSCLILIGFAAIIYLVTLIDSLDDLKEYWWQIVLALFMGGIQGNMLFAFYNIVT